MATQTEINNPQLKVMSQEHVIKAIEEMSKTDSLFNSGSLISLSIGKASWTVSLTPQMMGLPQFPENWKTGRMLMLPEARLEKIDKLEGTARRFLDSKSFAFKGKKTQSRTPFRFVHETKVLDVMVELDKMRDEFFAVVDMLGNDYETAKEEMKMQVEKDWQELKEKSSLDLPNPWEFISKHLPTFAQARAQYYFEFDAQRMSFPKKLEKIDIRQALKEKAVDDDYRARAARVLNEQKNRAESRCNEFIEEAFKELRQRVVKQFQSVLDKRKEGKPLIKTNIESLTSVIDQVRELDFLDDKEFHDQLAAVKTQLQGGTEAFKDNNAAMAALEKSLQDAVNFATSTTEGTATKVAKTYFARSLDL